MLSETGRKLSISLRDLLIQQSLSTLSTESAELTKSVGRAAGVQLTLSYLDQLHVLPEETDKGSSLLEPPDGVPTDDLNWLYGQIGTNRA